jgi:hypothetical protein
VTAEINFRYPGRTIVVGPDRETEKYLRPVFGDTDLVLIQSYMIKVGNDNVGVFLHELKAENFETLVIEKRTKNLKEIKFSERLLAEANPIDVFPKIFGVIRRAGGVASIFLEYINGRSGSVKSDAECRRLVSLAISSLNRHVFFDKVSVSMPESLVRVYSQSKSVGLLRVLNSSTSATRRVDDYLAAAISSPLVFCHNDIYWPNLEVSSENRVFFFDFGYADYNIVGADFHWFVFWLADSLAKYNCPVEDLFSSQRSVQNIFFVQLMGMIKHYCDDRDESVSTVLKNAALFAFCRASLGFKVEPRFNDPCHERRLKILVDLLLLEI